MHPKRERVRFIGIGLATLLFLFGYGQPQRRHKQRHREDFRNMIPHIAALNLRFVFCLSCRMRQLLCAAATVMLVVLSASDVRVAPARAAGEFTEAAALSGTENNAIAWGDYDNDGRLDLLVGSALYHNDGNGTFTAVNTGFPGVDYSAVAWGDYDNDGYLDVIITGTTDGGNTRISRLYHNMRNRQFSETMVGFPGVYAGAVAWADYNNDGRLDLLLTGSLGGSNKITRIYRNDGPTTTGGWQFTEIDAGLPGVYYASAAWGDYNNDGRPDILLNGCGPGDCSQAVTAVYRNDGNGVFTSLIATIQGGYGASLAWGDYDNDGRLDILISSRTGGRIYRNDGADGFVDTQAAIPGAAAGSVAWGDYDNDGRSDILFTGGGASEVLRHKPDGTFGDIGAGLLAVASSSASWADFDNDGKLDLALDGQWQYGYATKIYRNNAGTGNTVPTAPTGLVAQPNGLAVNLKWNAASDDSTPATVLTYNVRVGTSPGSSDVLSAGAAADGFRRIPQMGNTGHRTSATLTPLTPGRTYYWSVQAIDAGWAGSAFATEQSFTLPAVPDLTIGITGSPNPAAPFAPLTYTLLITNNLIPTAANLVITDSLPASTSLGSVTASLGACTTSDPVVCSVPSLPANSTLSVTVAVTVNAAAILTNVAQVSIDSSEVITANNIITDINHAAEFYAIDAPIIGGFYGAAAWIDYNNDGKLDLMIAGQGNGIQPVTLYRNDGPAGFVPALSLGSQQSSINGIDAVWGDYDNDGYLDLAVSGAGPTVIYHNGGPATGWTFSNINASLPGLIGGALAWGDYDNDGQLDLALMGYNSNGQGALTRIYHNSHGVFTDSGITLAGDALGAIAWADFNTDGNLDLMTVGQSLRIYRNDGHGTFTLLPFSVNAPQRPAGMPQAAGYNWATWGDFNNDGYLDLLIAGTTLYLNQGNDTFVSAGDVGLPGASQQAIAAGDFDNDGWLDVVLTNNGSSRVYRNIGGSFADIGVSLVAGGASAAAWGDYDSDGRLDLLVNAYDGTFNTQIYRNNTARRNTPPSVPAGLRAVVTGTRAVLQWDTAQDAQSPTQTLTYNVRAGLTPAGQQILAPSADLANGYRRIVQMGNAGAGLTAVLQGLPCNTTVYWSVQAVDQGMLGSPFSQEASYRTTCTYLPAIFSSCSDFVDDFSNPSSGWPAVDNSYVRSEYLNGEYRVLTKQGGYLFLFKAPGCDHDAYSVEADARWEGTTGSSYGLLFGVKSNFSQYYLFDVNTGTSQFRLLRRNPDGTFQTLVPVTFSKEIRAGSASNHLKAIRQGTHIDIEINGVNVAMVLDSSIPVASAAGLVASASSASPQVDARFDNFKVIGISANLEANARIDEPRTPATVSAADQSVVPPEARWGQ